MKKNTIYALGFGLLSFIACTNNKYEVGKDAKYTGFNYPAICAEFPENARHTVEVAKLPGENYDSTTNANGVTCYTGFFGRKLDIPTVSGEDSTDVCNGMVWVDKNAKTIDDKFKK